VIALRLRTPHLFYGSAHTKPADAGWAARYNRPSLQRLIARTLEASIMISLRACTCWRYISGCVVGLATLSASAMAGQKEEHFEKEITVKLRYLLFLPEGYADDDKKWPLMLFLHGSGESGDDLEKVKKHGPPKIVEGKTDFPFIVVSPQSRRRGWNPDALKVLLDEIVDRYPVDRDRVYLTGLSMGGYGTWSLAAAYPGYFAAIAPICGGGDPNDADKLNDLPIWVFHGAKDEAVPLRRSEEMVDALKEAGADVKFTVYPEAGHDSWTETYNNPELYQWFLSHNRGENAASGSR
jgi:predicted peptidase